MLWFVRSHTLKWLGCERVEVERAHSLVHRRQHLGLTELRKIPHVKRIAIYPFTELVLVITTFVLREAINIQQCETWYEIISSEEWPREVTDIIDDEGTWNVLWVALSFRDWLFSQQERRRTRHKRDRCISLSGLRGLLLIRVNLRFWCKELLVFGHEIASSHCKRILLRRLRGYRTHRCQVHLFYDLVFGTEAGWRVYQLRAWVVSCKTTSTESVLLKVISTP